MSHSHSHAPGEEHSHSHGPPEPQGGPQQQMMAPPAPDPLMQALIDASHQPRDLKVAADGATTCGPHGLEKCADCGLDFASMNRIARVLVANPNLLCPPPAKVVNPQLTQFVSKTKEEGNMMFKQKEYAGAIEKYSISASIAVQRPAWEAQQIMREELSAVLSNRSAASCEAGDYIGALVDADHVIELKRNWTKGHFRKAKALIGLGHLEEARDAVDLGLAFEPNNPELITFRNEIIGQLETASSKAIKS